MNLGNGSLHTEIMASAIQQPEEKKTRVVLTTFYVDVTKFIIGDSYRRKDLFRPWSQCIAIYHSVKGTIERLL